MPTITSTVYPTQTYTARLPVATGSRHGVDGALGELTKYTFADGKRIAMRAGNDGEPTYLYQDHLGSASLAEAGVTNGDRLPGHAPHKSAVAPSSAAPGKPAARLPRDSNTPLTRL